MSGFSFLHPDWVIPSAAATAFVGLMLWRGARSGRERALRLLGPGRVSGRSRPDAWLAAAALCIAIALLGPRLGVRSVWISESGVDLVVLIDTSRSMDARDTPPSRLDRARRAADYLLANLEPGDRAALAAFAGRGVALTPLTPDTAALRELLSGIDASLIEPRSSNLAAGVESALSIFDRDSERPRTLVVLSDGEDPSGTEDRAFDLAQSGVRVFAVALGTDTGATLPDVSGPLRDASGAPILSHRDTARLSRLTETAGGRLWETNAFGEFDTPALLAAVREGVSGNSGERVARQIPASRTGWAAALALGFLLSAGGRRWPIPRRAALATASLVLAASVGAATDAIDPLEARLRTAPDNARLLLRSGLAHARADQPEIARRRLQAAAIFANENEIAALAHYNLGVLALERSDYTTARDAFLDALVFDPSDAFSRFNLEWTLFALRATPPEPAQRGDPEPPRDDRPTDPEPAPFENLPTPQPESATAKTQPARAAEPASERDLERWMEGVRDDPSRALRQATGEDSRSAKRRPVW